MKPLFIVTIASLLLTLSCKDAVAPFESEYLLKEGKKLYIVDGYYKQVASSSDGQLKYYYEFNVFTLEECKIDGYGLNYGSGGGAMLYALSPLLKTDRLYHFSDTIRTDTNVRSHPVVSIFGYQYSKPRTDSSFFARYMLKPKN